MNKPAVATIALLTLIIGTARADAPSLKEGFWAVHMITTDNPGNKISDTHYSLCRNHAFDHHVESAPKRPNCAFTDTLLGNKHITSGSCHINDTTISTKSTGTYLGDTAVHTEISSTYTPALLGHSQETTVIDFKFVGACPAGIQPGDRVSSDGSVLHLWKP